MKSLLLVIVIFCISATPAKHPLHVSTTEINYNAALQSVEIISKIFVDDFEAVLNKKKKNNIDLFAPATDSSKVKVHQYLARHLKINIDSANYTFNMVGYELKKHSVWVYVEIPNITTFNKVKVTNSILHDYTSKQINIMHITKGDVTKSHKFIYPNKEKTFSL
jgi:intergrase/recombinase